MEEDCEGQKMKRGEEMYEGRAVEKGGKWGRGGGRILGKGIGKSRGEGGEWHWGISEQEKKMQIVKYDTKRVILKLEGRLEVE